MRRAEIHARVHALISEDRVASHAEVGCDAARDRPAEAGALLPDARCLEPLPFAVDGPGEHAQARLVTPDEAGVDELAHLGFAGFGAAVGDDDVELVIGADIAADRELACNHAQVGLDRAGRRTGGPGRAVQAVADTATDAQRCIVDRDGDAFHAQRAAFTQEFEPEVERGAEGERFERARIGAHGTATEDDIELCARADVGQRDGAGDHVRDASRFGTAHA